MTGVHISTAPPPPKVAENMYGDALVDMSDADNAKLEQHSSNSGGPGLHASESWAVLANGEKRGMHVTFQVWRWLFQCKHAILWCRMQFLKCSCKCLVE